MDNTTINDLTEYFGMFNAQVQSQQRHLHNLGAGFQASWVWTKCFQIVVMFVHDNVRKSFKKLNLKMMMVKKRYYITRF